MKLVIVESPSKAKTINKYLGKDYKVLASYGHIRDLPSKNGSVEPENDFVMHYATDADPKRLKELTSSAKDADEIILATDPDREGESISWHVLEVLREKKALPKNAKISRVVFNAITKNAVLEAMKKPREVDMDLVNAQQARRALDYLVGFTLSPVLWRKLPGARSAGRVQSVALRLICDREAEIEAFINQEYWDIKARASNGIIARLVSIEGKKLEKFDIPNEATAKKHEARISGQKLKVVEITEKEVRRSPKPPFITSTLQQEAARKLGFTAKRTMQLAQKLYEGVTEDGGLITYMRTDGVYVAPEAIVQTRELIEKNYGKKYLPDAQRVYTSKAINSQEAHEAIRPTDVSRLPKEIAPKLDADMAALYDLIWKRMVASQMENAVFDQTSIDFETSDKYAGLRATGTVLKFDGYQKLYEEGQDDEQDEEEKRLPKVTKNDVFGIDEVKPEQHFTEPPPRYSEASLVKKLEEMGIGRPSTYASIISVLQDREYVQIDKKRFIPEDRGRIVTVFLTNFFRKYVEFDYTANLEGELDKVSEGKMDWKQVLRDFWGEFNKKIAEASELKIQEVLEKLNEALEKHVFPDGRKCPACADGVLGIRLSKFGGFIGCSNYPDCSHTKKLGFDGEGGEDQTSEEPKLIGTDPESGKEITLRKGPYGWYVQLGEEELVPKKSGKGDKKIKPKRFQIPRGVDPETVELELAISYLSLPRLVGNHPETGHEIRAGIGRFGPYLHHNEKFTSLKTDDVMTIGINRAVDVLANAGAGKGGFGVVKELGEHEGTKVSLSKGRYGVYIKYGKLNVAIPKGQNAEEITPEQAIELIKKKQEK